MIAKSNLLHLSTYSQEGSEYIQRRPWRHLQRDRYNVYKHIMPPKAEA